MALKIMISFERYWTKKEDVVEVIALKMLATISAVSRLEIELGFL